MLFDNKKYVVSTYCRLLRREDMVIACHIGNGMTVKLSQECWEIIENCICDYTLNDICNSTADMEDKKYMTELFDAMVKAKILVEEKEACSAIQSVDIVITNRCNLQCIHCSAEAVIAEEKEILTTDDIKKIVDDVVLLCPKSIVITGGEPILRNDFLEIANYVRDGFTEHLNLMTNGLLISENNVDEIVRIFDGINISLDGYDEYTCSKIRGKGVFGKVINAVNLLIERGFRSDRIAISMVETSYTYENVEKFYQLNRDLGTKPVVREFSPIGRGADNNEELNAYFAKTKKNKDKNIQSIHLSTKTEIPSCRTCAAGTGKISINYDGNIYPCMLLDYPEYCMGNILEIGNVYDYFYNMKYINSSGYQNLIKIMPDYHERCSKCDVNAFCVYCLADLHRCVKYGGFEKMCKTQKENLEYIWRSF